MGKKSKTLTEKKSIRKWKNPRLFPGFPGFPGHFFNPRLFPGFPESWAPWLYHIKLKENSITQKKKWQIVNINLFIYSYL